MPSNIGKHHLWQAGFLFICQKPSSGKRETQFQIFQETQLFFQKPSSIRHKTQILRNFKIIVCWFRAWKLNCHIKNKYRNDKKPSSIGKIHFLKLRNSVHWTKLSSIIKKLSSMNKTQFQKSENSVFQKYARPAVACQFG